MSEKVDIDIRLQKAILAERRSDKNIRIMDTVERNGEIMWEISQAQWRWTLTQAIDALGLAGKTSVDFVRFPLYIKCPKVNLYERTYYDKGERKNEVFEAFKAGSKFTIPVFILSDLEDKRDTPFSAALKLRPPTREEIIKCFELIGENLGISPWGSKFGYGRFYIVDSNKQ